MKKKSMLCCITFFILLTFLLPLKIVSAIYDLTLWAEENWKGDYGDNSWGESDYNSETNQYELKAWNWLGIGHGSAWYEWNTKNGNDYFTPSEMGSAVLRIYWEFDGVLEGAGAGKLEFTYELIRGSTKVTLSNNGVMTYPEDAEWSDDDVVHQFTTSNLLEGAQYHVKCKIYLYNDYGSTSDFLDGGNGLELIRVRLSTG